MKTVPDKTLKQLSQDGKAFTISGDPVEFARKIVKRAKKGESVVQAQYIKALAGLIDRIEKIEKDITINVSVPDPKVWERLVVKVTKRDRNSMLSSLEIKRL